MLQARISRMGSTHFAFAAAVIVCTASAPAIGAQAIVRGTVVDRETGNPVPEVLIEIRPARLGGFLARTTATRRTDSTGAFTVPVSAGTYTLNARRVGYQPFSMGDVRLVDSTERRLGIQLRPIAQRLDSVVTSAPAPVGGQEFEARRRFTTSGKIFTAAELQARLFTSADQAILSVPGMHIRYSGTARVINTRVARITQRTSCPAYFMIDKLPASQAEIESLPMNRIVAMEVYQSPFIPVEFGRWPCGLVLVWTLKPPV